MKKPPIIDRLIPIFQRPEGGAPVLEPELVIAAALSLIRWSPGQMHGPNDRVVSLIMTGLKQAGYQIVPINPPKVP